MNQQEYAEPAHKSIVLEYPGHPRRYGCLLDTCSRMSYRPDLQERAVLPMKETNGFHTVRSPDSFALGQLRGRNAENLGGTLE